MSGKTQSGPGGRREKEGGRGEEADEDEEVKEEEPWLTAVRKPPSPSFNLYKYTTRPI
jgi:hypothetical protein